MKSARETDRGLAFLPAIHQNACNKATAASILREAFMIDFARVRRMMVDNQLRTYDITDLDVLSAMNQVPREHFVAPECGILAYSDQPVAVAKASDGEGRHFLAPMVFARIVQNLEIKPGQKVMIVAGALGYEAAVIARLGAQVVVVEPDPELAAQARARLDTLPVPAASDDSGHARSPVRVIEAALDAGCLDEAPFDAILINGAIEERPEPLLQQLGDHGRLAVILGDGGRTSRATLYVRNGEVVGSRAMFDAAAPALPIFRKERGFVF
jgi:protein-L-isoaspartate(D-aspartate) O-methyltransferase